MILRLLCPSTFIFEGKDISTPNFQDSIDESDLTGPKATTSLFSKRSKRSVYPKGRFQQHHRNR